MANSLHEQIRWLTERVGVFLTDDQVVLVRGDDARSWLSGQVTNNLATLTHDSAVYALAVSVKGRILSDLWIVEDGPGAAVVAPREQLPTLLESFEKHIIMEDVEIDPAPDLSVITIQGPDAEAVAARADPIVRRQRCARLGAAGIDVWVRAADAAKVFEQLSARAHELGGGPIDATGWAHAHVVLAIPRVGADFGADTYPQEAGLKGRAVSFNKGCYLGQEVICMLENRGQLSRRLVQLEAAEGAALTAGAAAVDAEGKRLGALTSVAHVTVDGHATTLALGYLKRAAAEVGQTVTVEGVPCTVRAVVGVTLDSCPIIAR